jgi:hypothetical protein
VVLTGNPFAGDLLFQLGVAGLMPATAASNCSGVCAPS